MYEISNNCSSLHVLYMQPIEEEQLHRLASGVIQDRALNNDTE